MAAHARCRRRMRASISAMDTQWTAASGILAKCQWGYLGLSMAPPRFELGFLP
jgi:hypothetical protein